jgi:ABC-type transporter MlaC component
VTENIKKFIKIFEEFNKEVMKFYSNIIIDNNDKKISIKEKDVFLVYYLKTKKI